MCEIAIPWQSILSQILKESKNALFTVCCRILLKLCAKVGGEPWAVAELPYLAKLTTVIGVHVTEQ